MERLSAAEKSTLKMIPLEGMMIYKNDWVLFDKLVRDGYVTLIDNMKPDWKRAVKVDGALSEEERILQAAAYDMQRALKLLIETLSNPTLKDQKVGDVKDWIAFDAALQAIKKSQPTFWTYSEDGDFADAEYTSLTELILKENERFSDQCGDNEIRHDEDKDISVINFYFNDDGERQIIERKNVTLCFEYYHGDFAEHNTVGR